MIEQERFDIFIEGEVIDLCIPSFDDWVIDQWYKWFNDPKVTKYLEQGIFPNTKEKQKQFLKLCIENDKKIVLLIKPKNKDYFVGVANLSSIDTKNRRCDFAMVIGKQENSSDSIFYAIETKCRMTEHAFEKLGVERINSGQINELIKWQRWQMLFGYQIEGILRKSARKGHKVYDSMTSSCLLEDYLRLKEMRGGSLWPGKRKMLELLRGVPKETMIDRLQHWLDSEREKNWDLLKSIEEKAKNG